MKKTFIVTPKCVKRTNKKVLTKAMSIKIKTDKTIFDPFCSDTIELIKEEYQKKYKFNYDETKHQEYDIYNAVDDGADYVSNILVEPLAYNYKGV